MMEKCLSTGPHGNTDPKNLDNQHVSSDLALPFVDSTKKIFTDASQVPGNVLSIFFPGTNVDIEAQRGSHLSRVTQLLCPRAGR